MGLAEPRAHGQLTGFAAMAAAGAQIALIFALSTLPTPLYGDYRKSFGYDDVTAALLFGAYAVGTMGSLFIFGRLSDQIGRKRVSLPAFAIAAATALLFSFGPTLPALFVARALSGLAVGLSTSAAMAWIAELDPAQNEARASALAVAFNIAGQGFGPFFTGLVVEYGPLKFSLSYVFYFLLLLPFALAVALTRETVKHRRPWPQVSLKPEIEVPRDKRLAFASPGLSNFVLMSLVGFYSAITPSLLEKKLKMESHAAIGGIVAAMFAIGTLTTCLTAKLKPNPAMLSGAALMLPALAFIELAQAFASLAALLAGTACGGAALGFGYHGSMQVASSLAPEDKRAGLMSAYLLCGNAGTVLPVLGVGLVAQSAGQGRATLTFAIVIALLSVSALGFGFFARSQKR
jgi:MFS family permease